MNPLDFGSEALQGLEILFYECRPFQQVLGRIADQRKLWKNGQGTPGSFRLFRCVQNQTGVVRKVTDDRIDLAEREFH
jgi:hypothetical protein